MLARHPSSSDAIGDTAKRRCLEWARTLHDPHLGSGPELFADALQRLSNRSFATRQCIDDEHAADVFVDLVELRLRRSAVTLNSQPFCVEARAVPANPLGDLMG